jgi:PAS domain S-box-containing protein
MWAVQLGTNVREMVAEPDREAALDLIERIKNGEVVKSFELRRLTKDGRILDVWLTTTLLADESGRSIAIATTERDITERKLAEETLKRSEQSLNLAVGRVGTWSWDLVTDVLEWSPRAKAMFGLGDDAEVTHDSFLDMLHPDDRKGADEAIKAALKGKTDCDMEYRAVWPDGTVKWIYDLGRVYEDGSGKPARMAGSMLDITERKRGEEDLRRTSSFLESLIDNANAPVIVWGPDQVVSRFNHAFERLTGRSTDEVVGKPLRVLFPGGTKDASLRQIVRAIEGESMETVELPILRSDGETRTVLWNSANILDEDGKTLLAVIAQGLDITERKLAEETLKRSEENLNLSVGTRMGTWNWDLLTDELEWSPRAKVMFGLAEDAEVTRESFLEMLLPEDREGAEAAIEQALADKTDCDMEYRLVQPDGTVRWIYDLGRAYDDGSGEPMRMAGAMIDITERKLAEEKASKMVEDLARSNAELEKFAYIASHDLQEPLRMVANYTQLLQRRYKGKLDSDADEFIEYAVDGATRMQTLINELLAYSRVGTQGAPMVPTDLEPVLATVLRTMEQTLSEAGAVVTHDPMPSLTCDGLQIGRVFQNLIVNAVKFRGDAAPTVHIGAERSGGEWVFSVKDNGIGIEPAYFERIFVIFQRLQSRTEYPGTGMGLAISHRIVERHGGRIWVESQVGAGSTFYFALPDEKEV